jgi:hypothetical protein
VRPEWVNKWPNSLIAMWWCWCYIMQFLLKSTYLRQILHFFTACVSPWTTAPGIRWLGNWVGPELVWSSWWRENSIVGTKSHLCWMQSASLPIEVSCSYLSLSAVQCL